MKKISPRKMLLRKKPLEYVQKLMRHPIALILENIRSAYNVGALFRTADGALLGKIILTGASPVPPSSRIDKAALGATDCVPWEHFDSSVEAIEVLRSKKYKIIAIEQTNSSVSSFSENIFLPVDFPLALILGNEVNGVDQATLDLCDYSVDIPMYGRASSLNVATAGGIVVYEALRRLKSQKSIKT